MGCFEVLLLALSVSLAIKYHRGIRAARLSGVHSYLTSWGDPRSLAYVLLRDSVTFPCMCVGLVASNCKQPHPQSRSLSICIANLVIWITLPVCPCIRPVTLIFDPPYPLPLFKAYSGPDGILRCCLHPMYRWSKADS